MSRYERGVDVGGLDHEVISEGSAPSKDANLGIEKSLIEEQRGSIPDAGHMNQLICR